MSVTTQKHGFTLAEVLVTLMIIGVIASMTIPGLKNSAEERERVAQVKKAYSAVANATSMLETEYGPIKHWNWGTDSVIYDEMYIKQFNVIKNCKKEANCFDAQYITKGPDGTVFSEFASSTWYTFITADGMNWTVATNAACSFNEGTYIKNGCAHFEVDVNGVKKPNIVGVDIFGFEVTKEGAFPMGGCPGCTDEACLPKSGSGWACTAKLLRTGEYSW